MHTTVNPVTTKAALMRTLTPGMVLTATYYGDWDPRTGQGSFERVIQTVRTKDWSYESTDHPRGVMVGMYQKDTIVDIHDDGLGWDMLDEDGLIWAAYRFA